MLLTILVEVLLLLALLSLGHAPLRRKLAEVPLLTFDAMPVSEQTEAQPEREAQGARPAEPSQILEPQQAPPRPAEPEPAPPPPLIQLSREQLAAVDIARLQRPATPAPTTRLAMGPADTGKSNDTPRVEGTGPNGEPLYAASWYREPYDDELRGYLSTARGPGWGLIACRTVRDYRVEDCVEVGEYPEGSNIARAVLAAAWQFRVRPPRLKGRSMVGEWVRIRIDYELRRK